MYLNFHNSLFLTSLFLCGIFVTAQENFRTLGDLPASIKETSGLLFFNDALVTHNDSGNEPVLYELDTLTLSIKRTVAIANVENVDWEALAQDDDYIYIGDFGNNVGIRRDLAIHKVLKTDYLSSDTVTATTINFSYEDQTEFVNQGDSDWDAEAFFVLNDQLIILTKQWQSQGTVAYILPKESGDYIANSISSFDNIGLVTDATYNSNTNNLVLLGYSTFLSPFIAIVNNLNPQSIFEGISIQNLGLNFVQAEGITSVSETSYYISSEQFNRTTPNINSNSQLFSFVLNQNGEPEVPEEPEEPESPTSPVTEEGDEQLIIYQDISAKLVRFEVQTEKDIFGQVIFDFTGRKIWQSNGQTAKEGILDFPLENALYYFVIYTEDGLLSKAFVPLK